MQLKDKQNVTAVLLLVWLACGAYEMWVSWFSWSKLIIWIALGILIVDFYFHHSEAQEVDL